MWVSSSTLFARAEKWIFCFVVGRGEHFAVLPIEQNKTPILRTITLASIVSTISPVTSARGLGQPVGPGINIRRPSPLATHWPAWILAGDKEGKSVV